MRSKTGKGRIRSLERKRMKRYYLLDLEQDSSFEEGPDHLESRKTFSPPDQIVGGPVPTLQHQF